MLVVFCSCYMCNKSFGGFWELQKHFSTHKLVTHRFEPKKSDLNWHTEDNFKNGKKRSKNTQMTCSICGKECKSKFLLVQHAMTHIDRKLTEVQCEICEKWMKNRTILRAHEIIHNNESPLKCPHCEKIKLNERALKAHILQCHSKAKHKHHCTFCSKTFARTEKLKVCFVGAGI